MDCEVLMPDASIELGYAEDSLLNVREGDVVQFERVGFARLDHAQENKRTFYYAHK